MPVGSSKDAVSLHAAPCGAKPGCRAALTMLTVVGRLKLVHPQLHGGLHGCVVAECEGEVPCGADGAVSPKVCHQTAAAGLHRS